MLVSCGRRGSTPYANLPVNNFLKKPLDNDSEVCYIVTMKDVKVRVNKEGLMGSKSRVHRVKKGKGSYRRNKKHKKTA